MEVVISPANREDFPAMIQLADLTLPDRMNVHELKKYFELFPELIFKGTHNGKLIGFCCAGINMYQTTGWLMFSSVAEEFRGRGIGKRFIETRLLALKQFPHLREVLVTVSETNFPSIRALESFGFRLKYTEYDYYGPGKSRKILELPASSLPLTNALSSERNTAIDARVFHEIPVHNI
jgi:ribosomal protein S18 acetylase RimI-like enzyme